MSEDKEYRNIDGKLFYVFKPRKYKTAPERPVKVRYCSKCTIPSVSASAVEFDDNGLCSGCRVYDQRYEIDWDKRKELALRLVERYRSKNQTNYDCIIPVSGGKDSYYQVHVAKYELGLNPLLVTYHGNNYTPTGMKNLKNMREAFGVDHIFFTPSIRVLKVLNRMAMQMMGDMNWHAHCGIVTYPFRVAVQQRVPLLLWGEHGRLDMSGMFSMNDFVEFTFRHRHEHDCRGFEWYDFVSNAEKYNEELQQKDMIPWMYPTDDEIDDVGVRGVYIGNYFKWEANSHGPMVIDLYGFLENEEPFERTYRRMSNLDDMHENGIHDYLKYIKFGYGRATDHTTKDIRAGKITREQAINEIKNRDHIKSKDLWRWIDYVGWTEHQFDEIADIFRDPRVWWKDTNGDWVKDNIWDVV